MKFVKPLSITKMTGASLVFLMSFAPSGLAATATVASASPTGSIFKVLFGLVAVLLVMAAITWALKRMMPGVSGQKSVIKVVGGVSVGTRERVVVLEVAGRWLVVGVAAGQVNAIADIEKGQEVNLGDALQTPQAPPAKGLEGFTQSLVPQFSQWLTQSKNKLLAQSNEK
jgi:flagellar protein FliO/FliZ